MAGTQQINILINTLQKSDRNNQLLIIKEIATCIQQASLSDLRELLLFVTTTNDVEIMLNLFTIFTLIAMSAKKEQREAVITNTSLYHKLQNILQCGLPYKCSTVLNLITALVYTSHDEDAQNILSEFAKNMSRVSGCLDALIESFVNKIMHPDTRKALCICISECCYNNKINQEYCSHLIPVCIEKGQQGDNQILQILYSLLNGNKSNCEKFVSYGGCQIFTRSRLKKTTYLEVLGALVDSAPNVVTSFSNSEIPEVLREQLHAHGPRSQIGQWCNIILYYVDVKKEENTKKQMELTSTIFNKRAETELDNTSLFYQNVMKEISKWNTNGFIKPSTTIERRELNGFTTEPLRFDKQSNPNLLRTDCITQTQKINTNKNTVILEENDSFIINNKTDEYMGNNTHKTNNNRTRHMIYVNKSCQTINVTLANRNSSFHKSDEPTNVLFPLQFEPRFQSTPKSEKTKLNHSAILKREAHKKLVVHKLKRKPLKEIHANSTQKVHSVIDATITTKLFKTINESCASAVKAFKNIIPITKFNYSQFVFKKPAIPKSGSYTFTSYMKKRDVILDQQKCNSFGRDRSSNMCDTCNDTAELKLKLLTNAHLRETVEKLKIGINMYGCNFKKLSKMFWANEPYMTPNVLYNLYRKLILK